MATASISNISGSNISGRELSMAAFEVRVWGMDAEDKPFIQTATARHITEKGALLTGVLPVRMGETIGIKYLDRKGRFKVTWVSDQDPAQTRSVGVDSVEGKNIWGMRIPIPIEHHASAYADSKNAGNRENRRKAERYTCRVAADVTLDNAVAQAHAWVSDISRKGCYLQMISPFAVGSGIALSVYGKDLQRLQPLLLRGVVRTCHPMVGMGVEFTGVSEADLRGIQVVLEQLGGPKRVDAVIHPPMGLKQLPAQTEIASSTGTFTVQLPEVQPEPSDADARTLAGRIAMDIQKLESISSKNALNEIRKAAVHMRNAWHLCASSGQME